MVKWKLAYTTQAKKDAKKLKAGGLKEKAQKLLDIIVIDPFQKPPEFEKLVGDLEGAYSRRINLKHRLVYSIHKKEHVIKILRLWTHYQ